MKNSLPLPLILLCLIATANAQLISVNFEQFTRDTTTLSNESILQGAAGGLGTEWNQIQAASSPAALVDSTGTQTTIEFTTNFTEGRGGSASSIAEVFRATLTDFSTTIESRTLTITGLDANQTYDIWLMAQRNVGNPFTQSIWSTANAISAYPVQSMGTDNYNNLSPEAFQQAANYLVFRAVQPDANGQIVMVGQDDNDSESRLNLSAFQISPGTPIVPLKITGLDYSEGSDELVVTWTSNPGEQYGIYFSQNLETWVAAHRAVIPAHATLNETTERGIQNPFANAEKVFMRIGPADMVDPVLERVWAGNTTVNLDFSEAMATFSATDPTNYSIQDSQGGIIAVTEASFLDAKEDNIRLTTATPLAVGEQYTINFNNLTDRPGRAISATSTTYKTFDDNPNGVKVIILSGQSNMVGRGSIETGFGGVDGAIGSLRFLAENDSTNYGHLLDGNDDWVVRDDVRISWPNGTRNAEYTFGFDGRGAFGPEAGVAFVVGDHFTEPVLIIKLAWGGKSLQLDFRSPNAVSARGGDVGFYYNEIFAKLHSELDNFDTNYPQFAGQGYQIAGFGWHQGINDSFTASFYNAHEENLVDFVNSVRDEVNVPNLPFSIATTGHDFGAEGIDIVVDAQLAVADASKYPAFSGNVSTIDTVPFRRPVSESPTNDAVHWLNNGETLYLIGKGIGDNLVQMFSN